MNLVAAWFSHLHDTTGINFTVFYDPYDGARFLNGFWLTLELSVVSILGSVLVGVAGAFGQGAKAAPVRWFVEAYVQLFRNTPPLVQIYFFYFGISALLPAGRSAFGLPEPMVSGFAWACVSLTLFAGAFNVEIFRAGIEAIPGAMIEAAESLGLTRVQMFRLVVIPLALRICLAPLANNLVNLVKTTTLAYAIAVPELLYVSNQIWSDSVNVPEMMTLLFVIYMGLVGILVYAMHGWERWLRVPGLGT